MNKILLIIAAAVIIVGGFFIVGTPKPAGTSPQDDTADSKPAIRWNTQTDTQSPVSVKVTPLELGDNTQEWKFVVTLDSHSSELTDDMLKVVTLVDESGKVYQPIAWDGPGPGGHHREGVIRFNPVVPRPQEVIVKVLGVDGVAERTFTWQILQSQKLTN